MKNKYWFIFEKKYPLSFISHHDTARLFERGFRRGGVALEYSKGYNPQPRLSFALPLPVGVEGEKEYGEFQLSELYCENEILEKVNNNFPEGVKIKDIKRVIFDSVPKLMSLVEASSYNLDFTEVLSGDYLEKAVNYINQNESLIVKRRNKKGKIKDVDIKPMIHKLVKEGRTLEIISQAGSRGNVRPHEMIYKVLLAAGAGEEAGEDLIYGVKCIRKEVFFFCNKEKQQQLRPLWDYLNNG